MQISDGNYQTHRSEGTGPAKLTLKFNHQSTFRMQQILKNAPHSNGAKYYLVP